jgi:uncharacterized protein YggE
MRHLVLCLLLATSLSSHGADTVTQDPAVLSVTGEATVTAAPDMVTVTIGVVTQANDAAEAVAANNSAMTKLNDVLDRFGIADRDRRTSNFTISPRYDYERRRDDGQAPEISWYEVSNQLTVRHRDIGRLGELLDAVVTAGSNRIAGLVFGNADSAGYLDEARKLAVKDALHKARLYAEAAGGSVGRVVSISEAGGPQPRPIVGRTMMAEAAAVPVAAGENEYRAVVSVVLELE